MHAHVVGQAPLLPHAHEQAGGHTQPQMGLEQAQGHRVGMAEGHRGNSQHQHQLLGVLLQLEQAIQGRWAGLGGPGRRARQGRGPGLAPQTVLQQIGELAGDLAAEYQHGPGAAEVGHQGLQIGG